MLKKLEKKLRKLERKFEKAGPIEKARILKSATATEKKIAAIIGV